MKKTTSPHRGLNPCSNIGCVRYISRCLRQIQTPQPPRAWCVHGKPSTEHVTCTVPTHCCLSEGPHQSFENVVKSITQESTHNKVAKFASPVVLSTGRMQLTLHARLAEHLPHRASRRVLAMFTWSVKTRHAPSRYIRDARVYGHTTTYGYA